MGSTIKQQILVIVNYEDVVLEAANLDLSKRYYSILGFLKGTVEAGDREYIQLDDCVRDDVMELYEDLVAYEHDFSPAGSNA